MSRSIRRLGLGVALATAVALAVSPAAYAQPVHPTGANHAPVATGQTVVLSENIKTDITLAGTDVDGDALNFVIKVLPKHGTIGGANKNLTYTPNTDFVGFDEFVFVIQDGHGGTSYPAKVELVVKPGNSKPVANDQAVVVPQDGYADITLVGTDADSKILTYSVLAGPTHGTFVGSGATRRYTPTAGYSGPDKITFTVSDGSLTSNIGTVEITVVKAPPVNHIPTATNKSIETLKNTPVTVKLQGTDPDGDALNTKVASQPAHGTLVVTGDSVTYTPTTGYVGGDLFTFVVNDGKVDSVPGAITITVKEPAVPVNLAPTAKNLSLDTIVNHPKPVTLEGSDPEGQPLTFAVLTNPAHGTMTGTGANRVYTPDKWFVGKDSFTYTANDGQKTSAPATVTIQVRGFKHVRPVAFDQSVVTGKRQGVHIELKGWSPDRSDLDYKIVDGVDHGRLIQHGEDVYYVPAKHFSGYDRFEFVVRDGDGDVSKAATVTIKVKSYWGGHHFR